MNNIKKVKILVAHPAQQHSYKTAEALKIKGYDVKYATTVYNKKRSWTKFFMNYIKGENKIRAYNRRSSILDDDDVIQFSEINSLLLLLLRRVDKKKKIYHKYYGRVVDNFNKKLARYIIRNKYDIVISFDINSEKLFTILEKKAPNIIRILDMSAPNLVFMDSIFREELNSNPLSSADLLRDFNRRDYKTNIEKSKKEIDLAHYFLVASKFTNESLMFSGVKESKIYQCTYGIDVNKFTPGKLQNTDRLRCTFMGAITAKKGCSYLFEAITMLKEESIQFNIIGGYNKNDYYYKNFQDICNFTGHILKDKVIEYLQDTDVFIFPSLADGFGFAALEALSCGVPVIVSSNAGISDIIIDEFNGFKIESRSSKEIEKKIRWFNKNLDKLPQMKINARKSAIEMTWEKYGKDIDNAINDILSKKI
ncbi:glycosyltransferase family 4 protein [Acholeplasma granularum]|uniref:glycosyltransferase family 4 protein n=1 Tax=Acholeplasma granularum TaxID=264635 RepID=UPI000471A710|nr:glycosyltransferase family 4 protein [Acholeplasma granularum]